MNVSVKLDILTRTVLQVYNICNIIDKVNDYECICKAGYTDKNCSTGI